MKTSTLAIQAYFEADHDRLDLLFRGFQGLKRLNYPEAKQRFKAFRKGLRRHIAWEEQVLFPLFEEKIGVDPTAGPTAVMRLEHRAIHEALERLHACVRQANPESDAEEQALVDLLSSHNMKEERVLYPAIEGAVTPLEAAAAFVAMDQIPEEQFAACCGSNS